jgi:hypothetical protein
MEVIKVPRPLGTTFANLLGKLTVVRVECSKCGRFGRYPLHRLIELPAQARRQRLVPRALSGFAEADVTVGRMSAYEVSPDLECSPCIYS